MAENEDAAELLFFDTFSHEVDTDINLDLVQFPKPVYITQVRIIPLGARVQADFPGGVRLGATNPSKFDIDFFVNYLDIPGATFENLGHLQYNQNNCIHLECGPGKMSTDGLVLRGWYSTITLAVYGTLSTSIASGPIASPPPPLPSCDTGGTEELCNLATNNERRRNSLLEDETLKEEWKEPVEVSAHAHKSNLSDFERDEATDYPHSREHYHYSGDERERRLRKTSHSSDRSGPSRKRTPSENERDYIRHSSSSAKNYGNHSFDNARERDKSTREWSPEYTRHARRKYSERSRSDADESNKWPRTPPASGIDSPTRPISPDHIPTDYVDDDVDDDNDNLGEKSQYKYKARKYGRSSDSLTDSVTDMALATTQNNTLNTTNNSNSSANFNNNNINNNNRLVRADEDDLTSTTGEQFEPILSDDELLGDDDFQEMEALENSTIANDYEIELDAEAAVLESAINEYDPFKMPLQKFTCNLALQCCKQLANLVQLYEKYEKCSSYKTFIHNTNNAMQENGGSGADEERENFLYFGEHLIKILMALNVQHKHRNFVLQEFFNMKSGDYLQQTCNILQIGLDFEAACLQQQPTYKIRHIKVGARLAELLGHNEKLLQKCFQLKFDPFNALFTLYQQTVMALSLKLMLLRGIYAFLDTNCGVEYFLKGKINGYQLLLTIIQEARPTPNKYALQAIIKKLHLYEALDCLRETSAKLFATQSSVQLEREQETMENNKKFYQFLEDAMLQLHDALTKNALSYQQPKRFLPVSLKFDITTDEIAQQNFAHTLQAYFKEKTLAETLLLLFSQAAQLPPTVLQGCCDLLQTLLQLPLGVNYLVDDCFETTKLLVALLLQNAELAVKTLDLNEETKDSEILKGEHDAKQESKENIVPVAESLKTSDDIKTIDLRDIKTNEETPKLEIDNDFKEQNSRSSSTPLDENIISVTPTIRQVPLNRLQKLGIELSYKVQTRYQLDAIENFANLTQNAYLDANELAAHLHALYSQTCNPIGRTYTVEFLGLNNNLQLFLDIICREQCLQTKRQLSSPVAKYKSPVLSYAVDMLDCCVRYCEQLEYLKTHGTRILELAKNHDNFEPSVSAVLQEMSVYLKPLEVFNMFTFDDIAPLVEIITRSLDYINTFPGELIMALRILRHLAVVDNSSKKLKSVDSQELKQQYVALQFYAADGLQILLQILERICNYFEQPGLHTPVLVTTQGLNCCHIILSTLQILRALLTEAICCRDVQFKDLTAIEPIMRTYYLLHYFPMRSPAAQEVNLAKQEIIQLLLAYTQPQEVQDEESLHKSLWTQMLRELLKHIDEPSTFIPGLQLLTELLPLPLPLALPAAVKLTDAQTQRLIMQRKWWSAHLHPLSAQIAELIEIISATTFPHLSVLLIRVCLQLADLAPNMSLLISKTLTDLMSAELLDKNATPSEHLSRILQFFSRLTAYPSLKCSALSIINGKLWDLFQMILSLNDVTIVGYKCQAYVHRILESFLDSEISLISPLSSATPQLNLASALPPKEFIPRIVEAIVNNLFNVSVTHEVSALCVRNMVILTEHDITFYYLSQILKKNCKEFQQWIEKIVSFNEIESYNSNIESLVLLLRSLTYIEENTNQDATLPSRTLLLTSNELILLISGTAEVALKLLQRMRNIFEKQKDECNELLLQDVNKLYDQVENFKDNKTERTGSFDATEEDAQAVLPQTEGLVTQYAARPIFTIYDSQTDDEQLNAQYWLESSCIDGLSGEDYEQYERITCDLTELAAEFLSEDINLSTECKRVLHLSASPQTNRERTPTAPCFRTQRVEVEPSTGRPEKKLYVTPVRGRGFPRVPPSRGDLFRSRPPNTSRPPSLHVDDFLALETRGAQPTGPTGYNKIPPMMRGSRVGRNRGSRISAAMAFRKSKMMRTSSPSAWNDGSSPHYRTPGNEQHFGSDQQQQPHYMNNPFGRGRGRGLRARSYMR